MGTGVYQMVITGRGLYNQVVCAIDGHYNKVVYVIFGD